MNRGRMGASPKRAWNKLPCSWRRTRFKVVKAGNGQIALHSKVFNRFARMNPKRIMDGSPRRAATSLPRIWKGERFKVIGAGCRKIRRRRRRKYRRRGRACGKDKYRFKRTIYDIVESQTAKGRAKCRPKVSVVSGNSVHYACNRPNPKNPRSYFFMRIPSAYKGAYFIEGDAGKGPGYHGFTSRAPVEVSIAIDSRSNYRKIA